MRLEALLQDVDSSCTLILFEKDRAQRRLIHEWAEKQNLVSRSYYRPTAIVSFHCDQCEERISCHDQPVKTTSEWQAYTDSCFAVGIPAESGGGLCPGDASFLCPRCGTYRGFDNSHEDIDKSITWGKHAATGEMMITKRNASGSVSSKTSFSGPGNPRGTWRKWGNKKPHLVSTDALSV